MTPELCQQARERLGELRFLRVRDPAKVRLDRFPDFLILGPQRTGTTWLYHNLKKHPQIALPRTKETYYFSTLGCPEHRHFKFDCLDDFLETHLVERPRQVLKRHYDSLRKCGEFYRPMVRGEATATNALLSPEIIAEIATIHPGLKAILMLRDPVERAWSHARKDLVRKFGRQPDDVSAEDFARFFRASGQRGLASYATQLRNWTATLRPGHVFVGDFSMIGESPRELLEGLHRFFGVRRGERYFNKHLKERINPAGSEGGGVPDSAREKLEELLAEEIADYRILRELFTGDPGPTCAKFEIGNVATPRSPEIVADSTG
ncbi:MAG: sulfotransferase [Verrucomicrobiae bacterium]|nr:sulfotransferase [Verrucomicrobiae bacterium]